MLFWLNKLFLWIRMTSLTVQNVRNRWFPELKKLSDDVEKLEASVEEEVSGLKGENVEMRSHFNAMINET